MDGEGVLLYAVALVPLQKFQVIRVRNILDWLTEIKDRVERKLLLAALGPHDHVVAQAGIVPERLRDDAMNRQHRYHEHDAQRHRERRQQRRDAALQDAAKGYAK